MIVVDASAVLDGLLDAAGNSHLAAILSGGDEPLAAPDLIDVDVLSVMRRWEHRREISTARAHQLLQDLRRLPIVHYPARALLESAWKLRHSLTAYDAQYVALAQALAAKLLTTDERMAAAAIAASVAITQTHP